MKTVYDVRYIAIVDQLRCRRLELGWSHQQAARRLHVPRTWIGKVERRERRLDVLELYRLLKVYGMRLAHEPELLRFRSQHGSWLTVVERLLAGGKCP